MPAYTPDAEGSEWDKFTQTRPFKRCKTCADSLISSGGDECPRCQLAREIGPRIGRTYTASPPDQPAKPDNVNRDRPGPPNGSEKNYSI